MNASGLIVVAMGFAGMFYIRTDFARRVATRRSRRMLGQPWGDVFVLVIRYAFAAMCVLFVVLGLLSFAGVF
jgi:hypothetical protein